MRDLQLYLNPQAEHLLDWFHVTMRITVMNQMAKGLGNKASELRTEARKQIERLKWFLWHGNVFKALQVIGNLDMDLDDGSCALEANEIAENMRENFKPILKTMPLLSPTMENVIGMGK